jgi:RNA polymerase sigma factor (sigma-70 family)
MTTRSLHTLIHYLRRNLPRPSEATLSDAQLLERWSQERDPAAFELLLWRHGPMILRTCRRLLPQLADAEDAFQATFLVLVRKAGSIRRGETLPAWLHRVAYRIALRARTLSARRTRREQPLEDLPALHDNEQSVPDLRAVLDEEIDRLPARYRRAVILCCLEGKSQEEVAQLLACPRGTVSSWLTRGRERLRQRLLRRGIAVSAAGLTAALAPDASTSGMMPLAGPLVRVAAGIVSPAELMSPCSLALAERMLRAMFVTKMKLVGAVLLVVAAFAFGAGTLSHSTQAADPPESPAKDKKAPPSFTTIASPGVGTVTFTEFWSATAHGLKAGIGFRPGDQEAYEVGQSVTFVVYLRNVSDKAIRLRHIEPLFAEWMPTVENADGKRFAVAAGPIKLGDVPLLQRKLEPGEQITLGYPWFRIRPLGWRGEVVGPTCCAAPGRYKVSFTSLPLRLNDDKADVSGPGTGQVELVIGKTEAAKDKLSRKKVSDPFNLPSEIKPVRVSAGVSNDAPKMFYCSSRSFVIPFHVSPETDKDITTLILLVSQDQGKTWRLVAQENPEVEKFHFHAPEDGEYWFVVQHVASPLRGRVVGTDTEGLKPALKVCVDTTRPVAEFSVSQQGNDRLDIAWTATDRNLGDKPVTLEWAAKKDGPWHMVRGALPNKGELLFTRPPNEASPIHIRLRVKDKAGNEASAIASY